MIHSEFTWQTPDGASLYAQEWKPEGTVKAVVALVHGLGEHSNRYRHVAQAFNEKGVALIGFDLRGHGRSGGTRGHYPSFEVVRNDVDLLLAEAKKRYPSLPCILYGHSLGGNIVLNYALMRRPALQGVIATSPGLATGTPLPAVKLFAAKLLDKVAPGLTMANGLSLNNLSHDQKVVEDYINDPLVHPQISSRLAMEMLRSGDYIVEHAAEFPLPLLLMQGGGDVLVSAPKTKKFAEACKGDVKFVWYDGLYHELHNELQKEEVLSVMTDWIGLHTA